MLLNISSLVRLGKLVSILRLVNSGWCSSVSLAPACIITLLNLDLLFLSMLPALVPRIYLTMVQNVTKYSHQYKLSLCRGKWLKMVAMYTPVLRTMLPLTHHPAALTSRLLRCCRGTVNNCYTRLSAASCLTCWTTFYLVGTGPLTH